MNEFALSITDVLVFANKVMSSILVILAFSLLAYAFVYNFRSWVARAYALLLVCVMFTYAGDVALTRLISAESADRWLRFQWLGIAMMPAAYYLFSLAVLRTTNYRLRVRRWIGLAAVILSGVSALSAVMGDQIVGEVVFLPPLSYLEPGPYFWLFVLFFSVAAVLAYRNVWKARQRCITEVSRRRMTYILIGFVGPGLGAFPYLISLSRFHVAAESSAWVLLLALLVNVAVAAMLVLMSYTVAYFGVLTPDRVVRYRLIRFFMRGPVVAILVILAIQTVPTVERIFGLPRDVVLYSVITGVIVCSQLLLSMTKTFVDRLVYREDRAEIAWLRELDRRLLATTDVRQFLQNTVAALCELLQVSSGFVAAVIGPDLILEAVVGPDGVRDELKESTRWTDALNRALRQSEPWQPIYHAGFWIWPLQESVGDKEDKRLLGMLGVRARTETPLLSQDEMDALETMIDRIARALSDRRLQQGVFVSLRRIIPDIDRIQQLRGIVPYTGVDSDETPTDALLNPSPIHSPEFEPWVKDALSHYWGGPKLTRSPLVQLRVVNETLENAEDDPTKALRLVLGNAVERLRPDGKPNLSAPEWLLYNILEMRFIQGRKVREIADRLSMSESDLYRKQRIAIGQVARVLSEMEQDSVVESNSVNLNGDTGSPDSKSVQLESLLVQDQ